MSNGQSGSSMLAQAAGYNPSDLYQPAGTTPDFPSTAGAGAGILAGLAGGPAGLALSGVSLLAKGAGAWLRARREKREREKAEKRYNEQIAESKRRYEEGMAITRQRLGLSKAQFAQGMRQQNVQNENYYNERNYARANDWSAKLMNQINQPEFKNRLQQIYGG